MDLALTKKTAIITGGASNIGKAIAEGFAAEGANVVIADVDKKQAVRVAKELNALDGGEAIFIEADVTDAAQIEAMAQQTLERFGQIDILVNNAGATWGAAIEDFPEDGWDKIMDINVKSPFFLTKASLPLLEAAASAEDPSRVIMVGSIDGLNVNRLPTFSYGPSKAAIHHLARTLAAHLADRHITVNAIAPGLFPSKMTAATIEKLGEQIRQQTPLKRHGKPEDMAGVAIYLASPAASFVTGIVIPVDGGITGAKPTL